MAQNRLVNINTHHMAVGADTLVDLMRHGKDDRVRGTAALALLERSWGKPRVEVATTHKSGRPEKTALSGQATLNAKKRGDINGRSNTDLQLLNQTLESKHSSRIT